MLIQEREVAFQSIILRDRHTLSFAVVGVSVSPVSRRKLTFELPSKLATFNSSTLKFKSIKFERKKKMGWGVRIEK